MTSPTGQVRIGRSWEGVTCRIVGLPTSSSVVKQLSESLVVKQPHLSETQVLIALELSKIIHGFQDGMYVKHLKHFLKYLISDPHSPTNWIRKFRNPHLSAAGTVLFLFFCFWFISFCFSFFLEHLIYVSMRYLEMKPQVQILGCADLDANKFKDKNKSLKCGLVGGSHYWLISLFLCLGVRAIEYSINMLGW